MQNNRVQPMAPWELAGRLGWRAMILGLLLAPALISQKLWGLFLSGAAIAAVVTYIWWKSEQEVKRQPPDQPRRALKRAEMPKTTPRRFVRPDNRMSRTSLPERSWWWRAWNGETFHRYCRPIAGPAVTEAETTLGDDAKVLLILFAIAVAIGGMVSLFLP